MGTGTTGYCCAEFKVKFLGSELDKELFYAAKDRIAQQFTHVDPATGKLLLKNFYFK